MEANEIWKWRVSSYSGPNGECVEVAPIGVGTAVRDSKDPSVGHLTIGVSSWAALTASLRA